MRGARHVVVGSIGLLVLTGVGVAACGHGSNARNAEVGSFRAVGVGASLDPTIRPARLLPEVVDETQSYGTEPGGGIRTITSGLRIVAAPHGAILAANARLPQPPQSTTALPERLGGGFLFVLGTTVWRADRWLGEAKPIFTSTSSIQALIPGLDRVYVRSQSSYLGIDGRTGKALDLGPWPQSPFVASYAAADGWRAAAVTDLRGAVATFDAGATWRSLDLPLEPRQVVVSGDSLAVGGVENGRNEAWFEVRSDGSIARLGTAPRDAKGKIAPMPVAPPRPYPGWPGGYPGGYPPPYPTMYPQPVPAPQPTSTLSLRETNDTPDEKQDPGVKIFGKRPLAAAIEDGWPLTDGTAVVARDGALGRVRLSDGALTELVQGAFPLKPARCHPVSLTRANAVGAFGFVCGEPRGTTIIYAYEPFRGRLAEIKRFDKPRVVSSSGNGALAVRGSCAEDAEPAGPPRPEPVKLVDVRDAGKDAAIKTEAKKDEKKEEEKKSAPEIHPYCVLGHDNTWREIHVRGDIGGERVVVLTDGKIIVVSPPQSAGAPARLTILDKGKATTVPVVFPKVTNDVARVLRLGLWLDGFEERKPGVIGGWVEAGGSMLGLEIGIDGKAVPGQFIRDAGMPFVAGRYGFGWTQSRRGYETTDGGMTWTSIELPEPLTPIAKVERRACGPIGCLASGWLRVGWGEGKHAPIPPAPPAHRSTVTLSPPQIQLACEPLAPVAPVAPPPKTKPPPPQPQPRRPSSGPPVLGGGVNGLSELPPFYAQPATVLRESERGMQFEIRELPERYPQMGTLGRVYGWGPKTGEWETLGRWQVKWLSPFVGWPDVRASVPVMPPQALLDFTRQQYGYYGYGGGYGSSFFRLATGDDAGHALLIGQRIMRGNEFSLFELEADRAPVELRRADGEPFTEIDGVVRAGGRWFLAMPPAPGSTSPTTTIWTVDGSVARELVKVPRAGVVDSSRAMGQTKLARRSDNRAIGLVVDGQPTAERNVNVRWVLPIDIETGTLGEPEMLGYVDLGGRTLDACSDDVVGWVLDTSLASSSARLKLPAGAGSMHSLYARLRLTSARACLERLSGTYGQSAEQTAQITKAGPATRAPTTLRPGEIIATAMSAQTRYPLRCTVTK